MKIAGILALVVCILCGCSHEEDVLERGMDLRRQILQAQSCAFDANITADYGEELHQFSVSCRADNQGNLEFSVNEPETIAGITGKITDTGGKLLFDSTALHFNLMADDQLSPVSAPWIFLKSLRSGCMLYAGMEEEMYRLSLDDSYEEDALRLDIWLDPLNTPVRAEILYAGHRILSLDVDNFQIL